MRVALSPRPDSLRWAILWKLIRGKPGSGQLKLSERSPIFSTAVFEYPELAANAIRSICTPIVSSAKSLL